MTSGKIKFSIMKKLTLKWEKDFREFYKGCLTPRLIKNPSATYFTAYFNGILVGHCALVRENGKWILEGLRVRPEFRERGIGKKLTEMRVEYAISQGAKSVWYLARDKNLVSICCHMKLGFQKHCGDKPDCKITDVVWYKLDLTPEFTEKFLKNKLQKVN